MNQLYLQEKNLPSGLRVLYRPMLLISLGLHGLLLMIPILSEPKKPDPPKKEDTVKISDLLAPPPQPSPTTSPKPTPKKSAPIPQRRVVLRPPAPSPRPNPIPTPKASPTPAATPTPEATPTPAATLTPEATPDPEVTPTPNSDAGDFQDVFGQVEGVPDELVDSNLFSQPELFFTQESLDADPSNPTRLQGIERIKWISLKSPDEVFSEVLEPGTEGMEVSEKGEYGGGTLYELKKGAFIRYISLVKTEGLSKGTVFVVWNRDPNLPPQ